MNLERFFLYLQMGQKPTDISDARWKGMLAWYAARHVLGEPLTY